MISRTDWFDIEMCENLFINFCAIVDAPLRGLRYAYSGICSSLNFSFGPSAFFSYSPFAKLVSVLGEIANSFAILYWLQPS